MIVAIVLAAIPVFADLSLSDAQRRATANSAEAQIAVAAVREREAALSLARIGGVPHLFGDYSLAPQAGPLDEGTVEQHLFSVGAGISINDLLASSAAIRVAAAELLAAQRSADVARLAARESAVRLYFAALQAIAVERLRTASVAGARRDVRAADLRSRNGESPQLDVVRADVTLAQALADLERARADHANAVDALASATAIDPAQLARLIDAVNASTTPLPDIRRAVARALAARPELAALLAELDARTAELAGTRNSNLPVATVEAGYQAGVDTGIPVQGPQVSARIEVPLAASGSSRVAQVAARVAAAHAAVADERRRIALEVAAAIRNAQAEDAATQAADRAKAEASRALSSVEYGYLEGASSSLDVADARRTYDQASLDALVAEYQRALAAAVLQVIVP